MLTQKLDTDLLIGNLGLTQNQRNVGTELISAMCADPALVPEPDALSGALRQPLLQVFPPALLGRLLVVPYYPLSDEMLGQIVRLQLKRIQRRLEENHNIIS